MTDGWYELAARQGAKEERNRIVALLKKHEEETKCDCPGCESWNNAFEFLIREIEGQVID